MTTLLFLVISLGLLFLPIASASHAERGVQTVTLLVLTCAVVTETLVWFALRQRRFVRAFHLGLAALAGCYIPVWLLGVVPDLAATPRGTLVSRIVLIAFPISLGLTLFAVAMRRAFPRRARALAGAAIVLVVLGLIPGPVLFLQPTPNLGDYQPQLRAGFVYWTTGFALLVLPFFALMTLPGDWFERWVESARAWILSPSEKRFLIGVSFAAFALALFFSFYSFNRRPTTSDEIAQLWQARILLGGRLSLPADPNPEFFAIDNMIDQGKWMSQYPVGGPAIMALGVLLGAAWLINPILTALVTRNIYRFTQRTYSELQARVATMLFVASPMVLLMGASHMNHPATAWLATSALALLPVWLASENESVRRKAAMWIGLSVGAMFAIRPLDAVIVGGVLGLVMLCATVADRARLTSLLAGSALGLIPIAATLLANWRTTGSPLLFGYQVLWGPNHSLGLHDDPTGHPHTAWRALLLAIKYATQLNWIVMAWPIPIVALIAAGIWAARRTNKWDAFLFALFAAQLIAYAFYWHDGQFVGPRFLFTAIPAVIILVARAPAILAERLRSGVWWRIALVAIPVCVAVTWLRYMPPFGVRGVTQEFRLTRSRFKIDAPAEARSGALKNALVFTQEGATARMIHRLWGLGVSRPDASRMLENDDACALLDAIRAEESRSPADTAGRMARLEKVAPYRPSNTHIVTPDRNLKISDTTSVTPACAAEVLHDMSVENTVAYGPMLLENHIDHSGHISGDVVYVIDLADRNEVLRSRFGDRTWYRYTLPRGTKDSLPILTPYDRPAR